ncbi:MAG: AAA family ATPase [Candidatus Marinimicrobia bacterium]|nr:AAA family ATPase [Candidatus Neomarinimicrobiota bacterium]
MSRKYFHHSGAQLQELFKSSKNDSKALKELLEELKFRKRSKMVALKEQVENHLNKVPHKAVDTAEASPPLSPILPNKSNIKEALHSKYISVNWRKDWPWQAKSLDGLNHLGNFETEEKAAEAIANFHKISTSELLKPDYKKSISSPINTQEKPYSTQKENEPEHSVNTNKPNDSSRIQVKDVELSKVFKKISPLGSVPNRPKKWAFNKKDTIKLGVNFNSSPLILYRAGITNLISEMKKKGAGAKRIHFQNGKLINVEGTEPGYQFPYDGEADIFEGSNVTAFIGSNRTFGHIVSISGGMLIVSLKDNYGPIIHACVIQIDNTSILESLNDKLLELEEGKKPNFNKALAEQVVANTSKENPPSDNNQLVGLDLLNDEQKESVLKALSNEVIYIWGPPGTGKTKTLSVLIRALFDDNKKVLICSNTNQAVDQVLLKLCTELKEPHKALQEGNIVRIGNIAHEELKSEWSQYITVEEIIKRKSSDLIEKKNYLSNEISRLNIEINDLELIIKSFEKIQELDSEIGKLNEVMESGNINLKELKSEIVTTEIQIKNVQDEFERFQEAGTLKRIILRSEDAISKNKIELQAQKQNLSNKMHNLNSQLEKAPRLLENLKTEKAQALQHVYNKQQPEIEKSIKKTQQTKKSFTDELSITNKKLEDIAKSVMDDATIIGATVTKAFISSNQLPQFDVVVIDEASMVMLPALYYASGLASERVVISGDFRQLSPIVPTEQEETSKAIGKDIFEVAGISDAVDSKRNANRLIALKKQYRMNSDICDLISMPMYGGSLETKTSFSTRTSMPSQFSNALTIVDTSSIWPFANRDNFKSRYNLMHALAIRNLCFHLNGYGYIDDTSKLGICTPYSAQAKLLKNILKAHQLESRIDAGTVHRFQGDEKEAMILDIPDSLGEHNVGVFLQADRPDENGAKLFNVAVSRAQKHLIIFANLTYLEDKLPDLSMLREILYTIQSKGRVINVRDVLSMYPILSDLKKLGETFDLDLETEKSGLFKQSDFDKVFLSDLRMAKKSVVIFSGFVTPQRVGAYIDTLRLKVEEGVAIRCITRPPGNNAVSPEESKKALDALEAIGCVVDTRWSIHQKVIIIDEKILWYGSLNPLSHTSRTDEIMSRIDNPEAASQMGLFLSINPDSAEKEGSLLTKKENPSCPACKSRTTYRTGRYGPYWSCEECDWKESLNRPFNKQSEKLVISPENLSKEVPSCPLCEKKMVLRRGRFGNFYGCSGYPNCKGTEKL